MRIEQSEISLSSSHKKYHEVKEIENLNMWDSEENAPARLQIDDRVELSKKAKISTKIEKLEKESFDVPLNSKLMSIIRALEALTGRKINISFFREGETPIVQASDDTKQNNDEVERLGWGIEYNYSRTEINKENMNFSAKGSVTTKDGKEIDFKLTLSMQRSSVTHESISFKAGDALIDPLVLNFDTNIVTMSNVKHNFDLNLDGEENEFSFVGEGSGFLAIDKNQDGIINDGSELFGPTLGNGFEELKAYDEDGNGWIDENDAVFEKLLIWTKDEDGNEDLYRLKDKDIGALYLERVSTPFDLESANNNLVAKMRESSIFLKENGKVGTIVELDLVV